MFCFRPQSFGAVVSSWGSTRRGSHYLRDLRCARCGMPPPLPRPGARPVFSKRPEFIQSNFFVPEPAAASEETGHQPAHNIQVAFDPPPAHVAPVTVKQSDIQRVPSGFMPTNSRAPPSGEPQVAPSHSPILAPPAPNPAPPPPPPPAPIAQAHMVSSVLFPPQPGVCAALACDVLLVFNRQCWPRRPLLLPVSRRIVHSASFCFVVEAIHRDVQ